MAKKKSARRRHQAWVRLGWTRVPRTENGGVWIELRRDEKVVGSFQVTQGAIYFIPRGAKKHAKKLSFQRLEQLFKRFGSDYNLTGD